MSWFLYSWLLYLWCFSTFANNYFCEIILKLLFKDNIFTWPEKKWKMPWLSLKVHDVSPDQAWRYVHHWLVSALCYRPWQSSLTQSTACPQEHQTESTSRLAAHLIKHTWEIIRISQTNPLKQSNNVNYCEVGTTIVKNHQNSFEGL